MATVVSILIFLCAGCCFLLPLSRHAAASPLSFSLDFSNKSTYSSKILVQGDALLQDNLADLTVATSYQRGNDYLKGRISYHESAPFFDSTTNEVTSFATQFTFAIKPIQDQIRGDGMAFFLSATFPSILPDSSTGRNLGLMADGSMNAIAGDRFVAVVFTTFNTSDSIGIVINSLSPRNKTDLPNFSLNGSMTASITFNGSTGMLNASLLFNDHLSRGPFEVSYQLPDPTSLLPREVSVGLSAATGDYTELHQITAWSFDSTLPRHRETITPEANNTGQKQGQVVTEQGNYTKQSVSTR